MLTAKETPWLDYFVLDEETDELVLRADTPQDIREKYEKYCLEQQNNKSSDGMLRK
jgi:hypothetical protein